MRSFVPWKATMGMGRVALFGAGKRKPPTGAMPAMKLESSEARRAQKRAPREKPAQRMRFVSMQRLRVTFCKTAREYATSSGCPGRPCA